MSQKKENGDIPYFSYVFKEKLTIMKCKKNDTVDNNYIIIEYGNQIERRKIIPFLNNSNIYFFR